MLTLFPPQQHSHDVLSAAILFHGAALDSSAVGTGKTLKAVEISRFVHRHALVICPKAVIPSWRGAFEGQGLYFLDILNYEKIRNGGTQWLKKKGRSYEWQVPHDTVLIFDECHRMQNPRSQNAKLLISATAQGIPRLMLSATAAEDPSEMRALGYALGLHKDVDFTKWALKYGCSFDPWRKLQFPIKARPKLAQLNDEIYGSGKGHKVSRDDMGAFFSQTSIIMDPLDFGDAGEIQKLYTAMDVELDVIATTASKDKGASALTATLRARQHIEMLKIPVLAEMVNDCVADGDSAAVFLNFRASMEALVQRLTHPCAFIHGSQSADARQDNIDAFQRDDTWIIVCQLAAGGVGISLHDKHGGRARRSFISPSYDAKEVAQALGRIDRAGAQSDTVQRVLFAADTIEEEVAKALRKKIRNLEILHKPLDPPESSYSIRPYHMTSDDLKPSDTMESPVTGDVTGATGEGGNGFPPTPSLPEPAPETPPAHAKWSPSKLKYVELCPGFDGREGNVNPAAEMGTRIHAALEHFNLDLLSNDYERLIGERCLEAYGNIIERHKFDLMPVITHHEVRLKISLGEDLETFGTCDVLLLSGPEAIMIDWKTGKGGIDDAEINNQAQAYVLGAFQAHPEIDTLHFYFVIPQRDEVTYHTYRRSDCARIVLRLSTIIRRGEQFQYVWKNRGGIPVEMFNPQPNLCEFCANQWKCHAVTNKVFDIARKYGTAGLPVPDNVHGSETDNPEDLAKMLRLKPVIEAWVAGISARARQMAFDEDTEIPGFEAKERAGRKTVSTALAAWEALKDTDPSVTVEDFLSAMGVVSFNDAAEIVYQRAPRGKKTAVKNAFEDKLDEMGVLDRAPNSQFLAVIR